MTNLAYGLRPELVALCQRHLAHSRHEGIDWMLVQGYRTPEYQLELYAKGRRHLPTGEWEVVTPSEIVTHALPEHDPHCRRAAYDIAILVNGHIDWKNIDLYRKAGALGKELGLAWGGDFKNLADFGHFELPNWRSLPP